METTAELVQVNTRIESDLQRKLIERAVAADRSVAAELRQAIRAWVEGEDREPTGKAAA